MKKIKILKKTLLVCLLILFMTIAFFIGFKFQNNFVVEILNNKKEIAIVNMDAGTQYNGSYINYSKDLIKSIEGNYVLVNIESAKKGIEEGKYSAYLTFSGQFSQNIVSINERIPKNSEIYYEISKNLSKDDIIEVNKEISFLKQTINDKISYLYINSILEEYGTVKNLTKNVMENDKKDFEAILNINSNDLITLINLNEIEKLGINIQSLDMSKNFQENIKIVNQFNQKYIEIMGLTEQELMSLKLNPTLINSQQEIKNASLETHQIINKTFENKEDYNSTENNKLFEEIKLLGYFFQNEISLMFNDIKNLKNTNLDMSDQINKCKNSINELNNKLNLDFNNISSLLLEYSALTEYFKQTFEIFKSDENLKSLLINKFKDVNFEILEIYNLKTSNQYVNSLFEKDFVEQRKNYYYNYKYLNKNDIDNIYNIFENYYKNIFEQIETNENIFDKTINNQIFKEQNYIAKLNNLGEKMSAIDFEAFTLKCQNKFFKKNNDQIKEIMLELEGTALLLDNYKKQIDLYNPLLSYKNQDAYFETLFNKYILNNEKTQNSYKNQDNQHVNLLNNIHYNFNKNIKQLRQDVLFQNQLSNEKILNGLNNAKEIKRKTSQENIFMMKAFSEKLPYVNLETLKENQIQKFIIKPVEGKEGFYSSNYYKNQPQNNLEKVLFFIFIGFSLCCITLIFVINSIKNKIKKKD